MRVSLWLSLMLTGGDWLRPLVLLVLALRAAAVAGQPTDQGTRFAPGWNGLARAPAMGWRSWNSFQYCIRAGLPGDGSSCGGAAVAPQMNCTGNGKTCGSIGEQIRVLTARNLTVDGKKGVSLADLGYNAVGVDEGWEGCVAPTASGPAIYGHDDHGNPLANAARFPNLTALVEYGHARNVSMGWYLNSCGCRWSPKVLKPEAVERNYVGDVKALSALGMDAVKIDGCGPMRNLSRYAELMNNSGKVYEIENCHWGAMGSIGCHADSASSCPSHNWCPFNQFRTSADIGGDEMSWFHNLQTVIRFTSKSAPLSTRSCWAYPVGSLRQQAAFTQHGVSASIAFVASSGCEVWCARLMGTSVLNTKGRLRWSP